MRIVSAPAALNATRLGGIGSTQFLRSDDDTTFSASALSFGPDAKIRLDVPADPASPALSFVGDADTGLYRPAADSLGFTFFHRTGETS